jgi:hypothetical protein
MRKRECLEYVPARVDHSYTAPHQNPKPCRKLQAFGYPLQRQFSAFKLLSTVQGTQGPHQRLMLCMLLMLRTQSHSTCKSPSGVDQRSSLLIACLRTMAPPHGVRSHWGSTGCFHLHH